MKLQLIFYLTLTEIYIYKFKKNNYIIETNKYSELFNTKKLYKNQKFAIIIDPCKKCGLLSFYIQYLGCMIRFLNSGYIPIIDLQSFPNIFNGFNITSINENPWEDYFEQPFGFTLENVKKFSKNVSFFKCKNYYDYPIHHIYNNKPLLDYYHNIAIKYLLIKKELIKESNLMIQNLFKGSKNILGILARGTDYISAKPYGHPIPPNVEMMIDDIKEMDKKNYYDWFFLTTEDDLIRTKFIDKLGNKLKYIKPNINIEYKYKKKEWLFKNSKIYKNYQYHKIYLINILILSKCIDIVSARTGGAVFLYIISNGFRKDKIYYLGDYK